MITYITKKYENKGIIYLKDILTNNIESLDNLNLNQK